MSRVFVDTSALLPLLDEDDADHYALVESGALTQRRLGMAAFRALGEVADRALTTVWVDERTHRDAWTRTAAGSRRGPSLVDQVSFLVMKRLDIRRALALDSDFEKAGFDTLP